MRTMYGEFPEYHTSADNLDFVQEKFLSDSFSKYLSVIYLLENNNSYLNLNPKCEPHLDKRGLYEMLGGKKNIDSKQKAILWILNLSDGKNSLLDISNISGIDFSILKSTSDLLVEHNILKEVSYEGTD